MKIGLIGGGYWGKNLIREFDKCCVLHTICEIDKKISDEHRTQYPHICVTDDWNDLLNNDTITAICISLPTHLHYQFTKEALSSNKDVYVEKPMTMSLKEAEEVVNLAKNNNKILMVGHLLHYHPCVEEIKKTINSGKIGKIINIVSNRFNLGIYRDHENVLWNLAPHDVSVILSLCDNKLPNSVVCMGKDHITKNVYDIVNMVLKYDDKYININVNWLNPYKEQKMSIIGEKGMIVFDDTIKEKIKIYQEYKKYKNGDIYFEKNEAETINVDMSISPLTKECEHFIDCCISRSTPLTDGNEGLRVLKVLDMAQQSLNEKKEIYNTIQKYFVHETAIVDDGAEIGEGTKIWHFSHICKNAKIGKNCNIGQNVFIADNSILGDNCKIQNNVSIYDGVQAGNYVFFGPSCVLTNDLNPRGMFSKNGNYINTIIEDGATLGANSTIVCGNKLGKHCLVGAGAVVTSDVIEYSVVVGNPAKKIGNIDEQGNIKKERSKINVKN